MQYRYPCGKVSLKVRRFLYQSSKSKLIVFFWVCTFYPKCILEYAESNLGKTAVKFQPEVGNKLVCKQFSLEKLFFSTWVRSAHQKQFRQHCGVFFSKLVIFSMKRLKTSLCKFSAKNILFPKIAPGQKESGFVNPSEILFLKPSEKS